MSDIYPVDRAVKTARTFPKLVEVCENSIRAMWLLDAQIIKIAKDQNRTFSASETFVSTYFRRNTMYLQSSFINGSMGFKGPSANNQRTVYETILRGYLFIVNPDEANQYHEKIGKAEYGAFLRSRGYYKHEYLCNQLFDSPHQTQMKDFYHLLCESSHTEIKGMFRDFPEYYKDDIEDVLKAWLMLAYGNIQMFAEMFLDSFNDNIKDITKLMLKEIALAVGNQIPIFEPTKEKYTTILRFRDGNFLEVIGE